MENLNVAIRKCFRRILRYKKRRLNESAKDRQRVIYMDVSWINSAYCRRNSFSIASCLTVRMLWMVSTAIYSHRKRGDKAKQSNSIQSMNKNEVLVTELARSIKRPVRFFSRASETMWMAATTKITIVNRDATKVNWKLNQKPSIIPKPNIATVSTILPRRVPVICWSANAFDESRLQIDPELFSGRSK